MKLPALDGRWIDSAQADVESGRVKGFTLTLHNGHELYVGFVAFTPEGGRPDVSLVAWLDGEVLAGGLPERVPQ